MAENIQMPNHLLKDVRSFALAHNLSTINSNYLRPASKENAKLGNFNPKPQIDATYDQQAMFLKFVLGYYRQGNKIAYVDTNFKTHTFADVDDPRLGMVVARVLSQNKITTKGKSVVDENAMLDGQAPNFGIWDKKPRAYYILDNFYQLDVDDTSNPKTYSHQMRLAFFTSLLTHVAVLNDINDVGYSMIPIILSTDKNIGKSSFLSRLLNAIPNRRVSEFRLRDLFDVQLRGRLYKDNHAIIMDEISPKDVVRHMSEVKALATQSDYNYDPKYKKGQTLRRQTALYATTNDPKDKFAIHETDRRLQFIKVLGLPVDERVDFKDFDFSQVWAELNYYVQRMPHETLLKLTNWSEDLTPQNVAIADLEFKEWFVKQTNLLFEDEKLFKTKAYKNFLAKRKNDIFVGLEYYHSRLCDYHVTSADEACYLLDNLNIPYKMDNHERPAFSQFVFNRRVTSFVATQIASVTRDFGFTRVRVDNARPYGFKVKAPCTISFENHDGAPSAIIDRSNLLKQALLACENSPTIMRQSIQVKPYKTEQVQIINKQIVEFLTMFKIPNKLVKGFDYLRSSTINGKTYYHYIGVVTESNAGMLEVDKINTVDIDTPPDECIVSIEGDYIFVGETLPMLKTEWEKIELDNLIENAIVPFIARAYGRQLRFDHEQSAKKYDVDFHDIFA